jgi:tetratricopeptide (TPR) repeat protein
MRLLRSLPKENWILSNNEFLKGFLARLDGNLPEAERCQRRAIEYVPGSFSAARELASICLARGNIRDAEDFSRRAFAVAPRNPYVLDILAGVLIASFLNGDSTREPEIADLLGRLKDLEGEENRSFHDTRSAEYDLARGRIDEAYEAIGRALSKTPHIFNVHFLRARIGIKIGNSSAVWDAIKEMERMVNRSSVSQGRTNLRQLLDTKSEYYLLVRRFDLARGIYKSRDVYDDDEITEGFKRIDMIEGFARQRS